MLFCKEHKGDTECMHCGRSRSMKVVNEDGASVTTKVAVKQLCYMPITLRLEWLYLSEETVKHMRWHKEGKRNSEDPDIMSHPADTKAWETQSMALEWISSVWWRSSMNHAIQGAIFCLHIRRNRYTI
jgi:hypothetical protein